MVRCDQVKILQDSQVPEHLAGGYADRLSCSGVLMARSERCRRISVRALLPIASMIASTSSGMFGGFDRRGTECIVPDSETRRSSSLKCI